MLVDGRELRACASLDSMASIHQGLAHRRAVAVFDVETMEGTGARYSSISFRGTWALPTSQLNIERTWDEGRYTRANVLRELLRTQILAAKRIAGSVCRPQTSAEVVKGTAPHRLLSAVCCFIVGSGLVLGCAKAAEKDLRALGLQRRRNAMANQQRTLSDTGYQCPATALRFSPGHESPVWEPSGWTRARNRLLLTSSMRKAA